MAEVEPRPRFSPSDAAVEGFQTLPKHWRVVVGWSGFQVISVVALCILMVILLMAVVPFTASRDAAGQAGGVIGGVLLGLGGLLIEFVILCGLYRLLLRPEEPGFMHLRVGRDEARVLGAVLLVSLLAIPLLLLTSLIVAGVGRVSVAGAVVLALALLLGDYAILLRLGLTPVIAFAEHRISPIQSWRRTRGVTWSLLGMALLRLCLLGLLMVITWIALFVLSGLLTGFSDLNLTDAETVAAHPGRFILQGAAELVLAPLFLVVGQAPWVSVYRALTPTA